METTEQWIQGGFKYFRSISMSDLLSSIEGFQEVTVA